MNLEACLPAELQGSSTTITRVAAGLSGAGVYKVDTPSGSFVLKVSGGAHPLADWERKLRSQQLAANAGLAPRIVHVDRSHRAVLSEFVVDRSFPPLFFNPATRDAAIALLGRTLRRVHELPLDPEWEAQDSRAFLADTWSRLEGDFAVPVFVVDAVKRALGAPPRKSSPPVLSHNDVNPSNVVYDGERILLLDWDTSGPNDAYYDLAAIAVFLRMDEETCRKLIAAHDDAPIAPLPAEFVDCRRLASVLCGTMFLRLAHYGGHPGANGDESSESTISLSEFYQHMRGGEIDIATAEGQWIFGLALVKESVAW